MRCPKCYETMTEQDTFTDSFYDNYYKDAYADTVTIELKCDKCQTKVKYALGVTVYPGELNDSS
ncbi:hypothetical protein LCGC14_3015350 [marine sediment metagenome]|uniref:Uncharacterized protein n=1 Tax=marine sediment metagenome TaxID=412755 RepID=A0A0F8ZN17_9ZZZZ